MDVHNLESLAKVFENRMQEYENKLQKVTEDSIPQHTDIVILSKEFSEFKTMIWELFNNIKTQMESLKLGLDKHETIMRKKVLLFHGVNEKQQENLPEVILKIVTEQMKLTDIHRSDLQVCHRLGVSSQAKTRPLLVRFSSLEPRQVVWDAKTSLKGSGVTISEFLTKTRHQIFTSARKHFGLKNCWSTEGKIVVIFPDKQRRKIETMASLQELISKFPVSADAGASTQISDSKVMKHRAQRRRQ